MSITLQDPIDHQEVCKEIVEKMQTTTKQNFIKNGCSIKNHRIQKIFMYDDETLVQLYIDKNRLFNKVPLTGITNDCTIEVVFEDVTCLIGRGPVFYT